MLKALSLDTFWSPAFSKSKIFAAKKTTSNLGFYFAIFLILANLLLLMGYIYGVNDFASKGYQIKALETQLSVLNEENRKINFKVSESRSMVSIQSGVVNSNFVQVGTPQFLEVRPSQFTQR